MIPPMSPNTRAGERGYALVAALTALLVVTVATTVSLHRLVGLRTGHAVRSRVISAFHLAEAGLAKAHWELANGNSQYRGDERLALGDGVIRIDVGPQSEDGVYEVTATARVVRGSGVASQRTLRACLRRSKDGAVELASWSQVRAGTRVPPPGPGRLKSVDSP